MDEREEWKVEEDCRVEIRGRVLLFPKVFVGMSLRKYREGMVVVLTEGMVAKFVLMVDYAPEGEPCSVDEILRPLPQGFDRLEWAVPLPDAWSADEFAASVNETLPTPLELGEHDWVRVGRIARKFGHERILAYFRAAQACGVRDPAFYMLEVVPNPLYAIERIEEVSRRGQADRLRPGDRSTERRS